MVGDAGTESSPVGVGTDDGAGAGPEERGGQSAVSPIGYLTQIAEIYCEQAFGCRETYPGEAATFEATYSAALATCASHLVGIWNPEAIEREIAKGRVEFDGTAAVACLGGVAFGSCAEHWQTGIQWGQACFSVLVGNVPAGGSCESSYACVSGSCDLGTHLCL
jgi:hypothetical protein